MKMLIAWHEECLKNMVAQLVERRKELNNFQLRVGRLHDECSFLAKQILEAKRRGKSGFDQDRFLKRKESQ